MAPRTNSTSEKFGSTNGVLYSYRITFVGKQFENILIAAQSLLFSPKLGQNRKWQTRQRNWHFVVIYSKYILWYIHSVLFSKIKYFQKFMNNICIQIIRFRPVLYVEFPSHRMHFKQYDHETAYLIIYCLKLWIAFDTTETRRT